ncbi:MAG: hypothetical protein HRF44_06600 [Ignavibacterium sp.]|jgi:thiol:disulfide interchange protein DsbD
MKRMLNILAILASFTPAYGQIVGGKVLARPELLYEITEPGASITVGIRFVLEPGWYLYWKNPGDSGLPLDVAWELPEGWEASPLKFPVPQKFVYDNLVSYGYKNEVVFLATITPGSSPMTSLKAKLDWLVCKESCLRGSAEVEVPLTSSPKGAEILASGAEKLPRPSSEQGILPVHARTRKSGSGWEAEVALGGSGAEEVIDFYPDLSESLFIELASIRVEDKVLKIRFEVPEPAPSVVSLSGLFITPSAGFQTTIPLQLSSM